MKVVSFEIYTFDELSPAAQQKAIKQLKTRAADDYSDFEWEMYSSSEKWFLDMAGVKLAIEQSSQGFYCRWHKEINPQYEKTDEETFRELQKRMEEEYKDDEYNHLFYAKCMNYKPDYNKSYSSYVADVVIQVCERIYDLTLEYYRDEATIDYIRSNEIMFLEDGKEYKL